MKATDFYEAAGGYRHNRHNRHKLSSLLVTVDTSERFKKF